jgi:predicted Fe-Mo cluster-binding NifX family protein
MKLILTTVAPDLDAALDRYFGLAAHFLVVDSHTLEWQSYPNPGAPTAHAAGARAASLASKLKPDAVISGDYGPYCYIGLEAAGIPMYLCGQCKTAREAVDAWRAGQLKRVYSATMSETAQ